MPSIKPFCALKPAINLIDKVVTRPLEYYGIGEAKLIASENPFSFLHLISPELVHPYLRGSRQELVYKAINENLDEFIENETLVNEIKETIYVYQVNDNGLIQTGLWTLTHINDYLTGKIKKHELTVEFKEKLLADYLQQSGLDANPVLITYHPNEIIQSIIHKYTLLKPDIDFCFVDNSKHRVWNIDATDDLEKLIDAFNNMPAVYIADGHHRAASMAKMAMQKRNLTNSNEKLAFNYFSTVYMDTSEVKVLAYHRLIKDLNSLTEEMFLKAILVNFDVEKVNDLPSPIELHEFGMYLKSGWYLLKAKEHTYTDNPVSILDVSILQDFILDPILNINNPRTDTRLNFEGERTPINKIQKQVDNGYQAVAFLLNPILIDHLITIANCNEVMPPKSTWIEPKFLVGLLTNTINR